MGEAKRRRQLDANYGTTQLPNEFAQIFDDFVNKLILQSSPNKI
ncbi:MULTISPECIES: hypothetical protein [unclassified Nostoc]|nr:hypothetical protein [Nostoc sp. JL23]